MLLLLLWYEFKLKEVNDIDLIGINCVVLFYYYSQLDAK